MTLSISDLVPAGRPVPLGNGKTVDVRGLSPVDIGGIIHRFPDVLDEFRGKGTVAVVTLIATIPLLAAAVLAASVGKLGETEWEQAFARLTPTKQLMLLEAVVQETIGSEDDGPFVDRVKRLGRMLGIDLDKLSLVSNGASPTPESSSPTETVPASPSPATSSNGSALPSNS